jgi:hypothetical protein
MQPPKAESSAWNLSYIQALIPMDFTMHGEEVALPSQQTDAADDATRPPDFYFEPSEMPAFDERLEIMCAALKSRAIWPKQRPL